MTSLCPGCLPRGTLQNGGGRGEGSLAGHERGETDTGYGAEAPPFSGGLMPSKGSTVLTGSQGFHTL